jgi:hypothetical protein
VFVLANKSAVAGAGTLADGAPAAVLNWSLFEDHVILDARV